MNKLEFLNILANAPKNLKNYSELLNYARNIYKQMMGVFPEGIDNISIKQAADEVSKNRKKIIKFPEGGKDKTDFFSTRPDPRVKQPPGAKMDVQRAHENISGGSGYAEGDTKYNADILGEEIARMRGLIDEGQDTTDMDPKAYSKIYDEAYSYLTGLRMLNRKPPGKGELSVTIEGETKNMTPEGIMDFIMSSGLKGTDTNIGKAPKTIKTKPKVDPVLQQSEDQKQMFLDFENRNETEAEIIARMNRQNKEAAERLRKKKEKDLGDKLKELPDDIDPDALADGGRIGFDKGGGTGVAGDQMEGDQYVISDIPGNPQVPMGQFGPLNVGIFGGGSYGKNEIIPGVDMATTDQNYGIVGQFPIGETGFSIGGNYLKSRVNERFTGGNNQVFKSVPTDSDRFNVGINFRKSFKEGGPPNPGRRNFMKLMAGLASLPVIGKLFKGAKVAEKVVQLKNTTTTMPAWFPQFVEKFISKGVGKKIDQDLMEFTNPDLPNIKVTKADDGRVFVEGQNDYYKNYEIDYTPPGYEVVDEKTGKAVKTKGDFMAQEEVPVNVDPDGNADFDAEILEDVDQLLTSDARAMEEFATGKKIKEMKQGEISVGRAEAKADAARKGEDFAKGGLAYMLGE